MDCVYQLTVGADIAVDKNYDPEMLLCKGQHGEVAAPGLENRD
jgi:hypothetical protein